MTGTTGSGPSWQEREADRLIRATLSLVGEPGDLRITEGVALVGPVELHRQIRDGTAADGLADDVRLRTAEADAPRALELAERTGTRFVVPWDPEWPRSLDALAWSGSAHERGGVPVGLWVRGPLRLDELGRSVAVVGSRSATTYGTGQAGALAHDLGRVGVPVVSGGAFGIDVAAHRGALAGRGRTVAVLACGVDRVYPQAHEHLLEHCAAEHLLVSETAPGLPPSRIRFLSRNRVIAALAVGTVVVEAALRSGALSTAHWATRTGRHLMGVPGPVSSPQSAGVHRLLRDGEAVLVTNAEDVLEVTGHAGEHLLPVPPSPQTVRDRLTPRQRQVLEALPRHHAARLAEIGRAAGVSTLGVTTALGTLVRRGLVEQDGPGFRLTGADADRLDETLLDSSA
ncbi:DNA-processing protein DprA [Nocardioides sp. GY 10127]|uniref:DNA-processing protein DprA n=1 Tax=Nocardioides sp. GY 10127 TaxID=2569762 RepID=UPI0010A86A05|nr:DNA-processing protein DprA [Nocardioides sp. GY 10127]TIC80854.1 DNA-protecting protein DprA [Nocardioides sp. GY 10127]